MLSNRPDANAGHAPRTTDNGVQEAERLRLALAAGHMGIWEWEIATAHVYWSPECFTLLNISPSLFAGTLDDFGRLLHPDDAPRVWARVEEALAGGAPFEADFRVVRPDGALRWFTNRGSVVRDASGAPQKLVGVVTDITSQKQAEQALAESERRYRRLHDSIRDAVAVVDMSGRILESNLAFREMLGYSEEELSRLTYEDLTPPRWHAMEARIVKEQIIAAGASDVYEKEYQRKDGSVFPIELRAFLLRNDAGQPHQMWAIVRDISERKRTERALHDSEERFRAFVTASSDVVYRMNADWSVMHHLDGKDFVADTQGPTSSWLDTYIHPDDRAMVLAAIRQAVETKTPFELEHRVLRMKDTVGWTHSRAIPLLDDEGNIVEWFGTASDVTVRKQTEEALDVVRRHLEAAVEASQVVLFHQDLALRYTWIHNPALGYATTEVLGKTDRELFERAEDAVRTEAVKWAAIETGATRREEVAILHAGREHVFDLVVRPDINARGEVTGVRCAAIDITARKHAEAATRAAGQSFRALVEQSPFGVYAVDADFRLVMVSAGAQKVFETVRPLLGRDFEEVLRTLWPEPFATEALGHFRDTLATGTPFHAPRTVEQRADSGETEAYDWKLERMILPDGRLGVVCHFYDLSERQRHEDELRRAAARYRTLLDVTNAVTFSSPPNGKHIAAQASWMAFTGQSAEDVLGDGWSAAVHPDDAPAVKAHWLDAVAREVPFESEHRVRRHDGAWRWMQVTAAPVRDANERVVEWFGAAVDITDRRAAEDELREADVRKDQFVAVLAHELRNPLAPVRTAIALLKTGQVLDPVLARSRDVIDRQVTHMARLLDDLLDVSRLSRGTLTLQRSRVLLREILAAAIEVAAPLFDQRAQVVEIVGLDGSIGLESDAARLIQVFGNLLTNASKFSPSHAKIKVAITHERGTVAVSVQDTGTGIAAEHLDTVFEMFSQVGSTDHTSAGGLGIGLALVKRLVDLHGGSVVVASDGLGRGSTFTVRLPAFRLQTASEAVGEAAGFSDVVVRCRVLIADDNVDAADTLAMLLTGFGCEVRTVYGGEQAIHEAEVFKPAVALLDLGMPDIEGQEVCRRIRSQSWGATMTLVAVTGWGRDEDRRQTQLAGFDHHLLKPVDPESVLELITTNRGGTSA